MKRNTITVIYATGIIIIILLALAALFFENLKLLLPAGIIAVALFLFSFPDKNKSEKEEKDRHKNAATDDEKKTENTRRASEKGIVSNEAKPITCEGETVYINTPLLNRILTKNEHYNFKRIILLKGENPVIKLCENGVVTREYKIETEENEDFSDKFFKMKMSVYYDKVNCLAVLTEGYVTDTLETAANKDTDDTRITYRFEKHFLERNTKNICQASYERTAGKELESKGLRFPGMTVSSNLRCVGICQKCEKPITFHTYNVSKQFAEPVYSDDGCDVYLLKEKISERRLLTWNKTVDGKVFRYYNSFCCPNCGEPYIDYRKYKELKRSGNLACVLLGRNVYKD